MDGIRRRIVFGLAAGSLGLALAAGPAAAATPVNSTWSDSWTVQHDCGVVESTSVTAREHAFFEGGTWIRSIIQFDYVGLFVGPTGKTLSVESHQNGTFTPTTGKLSGQGTFLRGAGGVLVMDVGNLVFEIPSGTTLRASAQVLRFDDPDPGVVDAALCAALG
jgi:hypothetical protein